MLLPVCQLGNSRKIGLVKLELRLKTKSFEKISTVRKMPET